ncbi:MAG: hypothetical protein NTX36_15385 [Proteobacteria bacterium]|nr:hypothetical protein [Pseudomonadota bacterium]
MAETVSVISFNTELGRDIPFACHRGQPPGSVAISKDGIPSVIIGFPTILRISANIAESSGSTEKNF